MDACTKSEAGAEKRVFSIVEADAQETTKCVKRRRRSPPLVTLSCNDQRHPPAFQLDQTATPAAPTTTMKRSSRFRGVSRYEE